MENVKVSLAPQIVEALAQIQESPEDTIARLIREKQDLLDQFAEEHALRIMAEKKLEEMQAIRTRKKKTHSDTPKEYSEFKSDGKRKAHAADPIRSYEDFVAIQNYFLERNRIRDWAMWTIGVSLGLRISDLLSLKVKSIIDNDGKTFRKRLVVIEQKTSKMNDCLITEAVIYAATKYFDSIGWKFELDDYLFKSEKTGGKMYEEYGWRILSNAGKALDLPIVIGSHTMRKSFANIAACVDKSTIDMNAITKIQGLLNHSDQRVTMRYLGTYQDMFDRARVAVSEFVLGRTDVHQLIAGNNYTIDDIMSKLEAMAEMSNNTEKTGVQK